MWAPLLTLTLCSLLLHAFGGARTSGGTGGALVVGKKFTIQFAELFCGVVVFRFV